MYTILLNLLKSNECRDCRNRTVYKMSRERASRRFYRVDSTNDLFEFMDRGYSAQHENRWNFEVAWEAANKGTLYT